MVKKLVLHSDLCRISGSHCQNSTLALNQGKHSQTDVDYIASDLTLYDPVNNIHSCLDVSCVEHVQGRGYTSFVLYLILLKFTKNCALCSFYDIVTIKTIHATFFS